MPQASTMADIDRRFYRQMKSLCLATVSVMGALIYGTVIEDQARTQLAQTFATAADNAVFTLEGAHAVTASYEGRNYTYNFDNKTVLGGNTTHVGFGGGGYGGMVSFDNFEDKAAITLARVHGCAIAQAAQTAENPGWPVTDDFKAAQAKAKQFALKYCP